MTHRELITLATQPALLETPEQMSDLMNHLKTCSDCSCRFRTAIEFDRQYVDAARSHWEHLSPRELMTLRNAGFEPNFNSATTLQELHLSVCPLCQERWETASERLHASAGNWRVLTTIPRYVVVALLLVMIFSGTLYFLYSQWQLPKGNITKSAASSSSLVTVSSPPQIHSITQGIVRSGAHQSEFISFTNARQIFVDPQSDPFLIEVETSLKTELEKLGYHIVSNVSNADARIRLSIASSEDCRIEYVSGDTVLSWTERIPNRTQQSAQSAVRMLVDILNKDIRPRP